MPELLKPRQEEILDQQREQAEAQQSFDPAEIEKLIAELQAELDRYNQEAEAQQQTARNLGSTALS